MALPWTSFRLSSPGIGWTCASANLVWPLRKRLSIGLKGLCGFLGARDGQSSGDHWRVQVGMVYSLFD
jgi:hypothetical protein